LTRCRGFDALAVTEAGKGTALARQLARIAAAILIGVAAFGRVADAQDYPTRPIQLVVPTGPGGTLDLSARFFAPLWSETLGQPIVVVNRAGGASAIGTRAVAQAAPDGYTLLMSSDSSFVTVPLTRNDTGYTLDSFTFLFAYGQGSLFLAVNAATPYRSLSDFLAAARQAPGRLSYASYGIASLAHFGGALLWGGTGVDVAHIPYRSTAEALTAVLGNHVDIGITGSVQGGGGEAGRMRVLATSAPQRVPFAAEVPTLRELGPDIDLIFTNVVVGPRGLPQPIVARLLEAHRNAMQRHGAMVRERLLAAELTPIDLDGPAALQGMRDREGRFRGVIGSMQLH
jgi:tripartite-type tricarboxylate transporter receptor subunit TctC